MKYYGDLGGVIRLWRAPGVSNDWCTTERNERPWRPECGLCTGMRKTLSQRSRLCPKSCILFLVFFSAIKDYRTTLKQEPKISHLWKRHKVSSYSLFFGHGAWERTVPCKHQIRYKEPTGLWKWYQTEKQLQWNLDITYLYTNEVLTLTSDIFCPSSSKININNLYITKPRYSEQILPVSHGPFSLYRAVPLYFNDTSQCKLPLPQKNSK